MSKSRFPPSSAATSGPGADPGAVAAREQGYVTTMSGRRRLIPDIASGNTQLASQARRQAINTVVQGSAADIIKLAMIKIDQVLKEKNLKTKMLLKVHDEFIFEAPLEEVDEVSKLIKDAMESAYSTKVPLTVEVGVGDNWLEAH